MKAVILAAGTGSRLAPLTDDRPKVLVEVLGRSMLFRQLDRLAAAGIAPQDVVVVGGYRIDMLRAALERGGFARCTVVPNQRYQPWNNFWSLAVAEPAVRGHDLLQLDGDVVFDEKLLPRLLAARGEALLAVDRRADLDAEMMKVQLAPDGAVVGLDKRLPPARCAGESIGVSRLGTAVARLVFEELLRLRDEGLTQEYYERAFARLIERGAVRFEVVDVHDCAAIEIDTLADLARAESRLVES
jgi:choline kinase